MNGDWIESRQAIRWERKRLRLGVPDPECLDCDRSDVRFLNRVRSKIIGVPIGSIVCGNCRKLRGKWSKASLNRKRLTFENAGYPDPACFTCGQSDLRTLELHHVAAETNSDLLVPLCVNCHSIQSDTQEDAPMDFRLADPERRPLVLQAAFEIGLGSMFSVVAVIESNEDRSYAIALGFIAILLFAWAVWNLAADTHFAGKYGPDYSKGVPVPVPR